jgi:hypothetical protein
MKNKEKHVVYTDTTKQVGFQIARLDESLAVISQAIPKQGRILTILRAVSEVMRECIALVRNILIAVRTGAQPRQKVSRSIAHRSGSITSQSPRYGRLTIAIRTCRHSDRARCVLMVF